jgi:hypothetical protein
MNVILTERPKRQPLSETPFSHWKCGDEVALEWQRALDRAEERTRSRNCKQQVRRDTASGLPLWVIQDVR